MRLTILVSLSHFSRHVAVFEIRGKHFRMKEKIPLQTVRPFYIRDLALSATNLDPQNDEQVMFYTTEQVSSPLVVAGGKGILLYWCSVKVVLILRYVSNLDP